MAAVVRPVGWSAARTRGFIEVKYCKGPAVFFFFFLQHKGAGCEGLHTQYSGCLLLRLCLRSLFPLPINGKHWLSPPSVKIMTCNVSSRAHDNQTIVIKYYYLYYSKWYDKLFSVVPLFWMKRGRCYHGTSCPLPLYIEMSYCSSCSLIATTECYWWPQQCRDKEWKMNQAQGLGLIFVYL